MGVEAVEPAVAAGVEAGDEDGRVLRKAAGLCLEEAEDGDLLVQWVAQAYDEGGDGDHYGDDEQFPTARHRQFARRVRRTVAPHQACCLAVEDVDDAVGEQVTELVL
ncbi:MULTISPECIES: hypothetical protein [unclassified Streptomyces]|uniref:hypothetical protein n=1 Tax=unclassified Streptomyces TaxID=2593676 RepID=UPI0037BD02BB